MLALAEICTANILEAPCWLSWVWSQCQRKFSIGNFVSCTETDMHYIRRPPRTMLNYLITEVELSACLSSVIQVLKYSSIWSYSPYSLGCQ